MTKLLQMYVYIIHNHDSPYKDRGGEGGGIHPPYGFLPFTQKIFLQPIPEISGLFPTGGGGYPYEIFFLEKFRFQTLTALLRHAVQKYFFVFCFNQKNLFTKPS